MLENSRESQLLHAFKYSCVLGVRSGEGRLKKRSSCELFDCLIVLILRFVRLPFGHFSFAPK